MRQDALSVRGLVKSFSRPAVQDLDLTIGAGEFYALLGPNGAGKTTTLRMVAGLLKPTPARSRCSASTRWRDPIAAKRMIAWLPDEPMLYDKLDAARISRVRRRAVGHRRRPPQRREAEELLERLDLWEQRDERCEGFSRGMKQKVALAGALIHDPRLLILDEPLTGLDAAVARQVKDLLQERVAGRRHGHPHHPHPRGRRAAGRPHRHHPARPAAGRGHARRAAQQAGRQGIRRSRTSSSISSPSHPSPHECRLSLVDVAPRAAARLARGVEQGAAANCSPAASSFCSC